MAGDACIISFAKYCARNYRNTRLTKLQE